MLEIEEELVVEVKKPTIKQEKIIKENAVFVKRKRRAEKRKQKANEPVSEPNVDNWFFKNFGLGRLFEEDDDQAMDE